MLRRARSRVSCRLNLPFIACSHTHSNTNSLLAIIAAAFSAQSVNAIDWGTICADPGFTGICTTFQSAQVNQCVNLTGKDSFWNDKISSIGVIGGATCFFFVNEQCSGAVDTYPTGRSINVGRDNQYTSFRCIFN